MRAGNCFIPGSDQNKGLLSTFTVKVRCKSEGGKNKRTIFANCWGWVSGRATPVRCIQHPSPAEIKSCRGLAFWLPGSAELWGRERALCCEAQRIPTQASHRAWGPGFAFGSQLCAGWTCWGSSWRLMIKQRVKNSQLCVGIKGVAVTEMGWNCNNAWV